MNCIIVDDDSMARKVLESLIKRTNDLTLTSSFSSSLEAFKYLEKDDTDLIFLDIEMPDMNGMEMLNALPKQPLIIFTTGTREYALEAFDHRTIDYLVKPIEFPRFLKAVTKAKQQYVNKDQDAYIPEDQMEFIFIKESGIFLNVFFKDITFIEALGDYITVNTLTKRHVVHATMKKFEDKLPKHFMRVHRSFLINSNFIQSIEDSTMSLHGHLVPIGVSYKSQVYKKLNIS